METTLTDQRPRVDDFPPDPPEEKVFRCEEHNKEFKSQQGLRLHLTRAHGALPVSPKRRKKKAAAAAPVERKVTPFDPTKLLAQVCPNGHVAVAHFDRVHAWLVEGEKLHRDLQK